MTRDRLQLRLWSWGEQLALPPRVFDGGQEPEVALGIPHDPLLIGPLDKEGHYTLCSGSHVVLFWSLVVQGTHHLDLTLSPVVPGCVAHLLAGGGLGRPAWMRWEKSGASPAAPRTPYPYVASRVSNMTIANHFVL